MEVMLEDILFEVLLLSSNRLDAAGRRLTKLETHAQTRSDAGTAGPMSEDAE